jgi:N-acetylglucosamine-6-phosphate deacetylase
VALVSDAVAACAPAGGDLALLGTICVAGDAVRVKATGTLAGSCLTLDTAVRRVREWFPRLALERVLAMASAVPARVMGLSNRLGQIVPGHDADLVVATQELTVEAAVCGGRMVRATG